MFWRQRKMNFENIFILPNVIGERSRRRFGGIFIKIPKVTSERSSLVCRLWHFSRQMMQDATTHCTHTTGDQHYTARQLSLYWEGDLRNPSYFLNKRKELEFFIWNLVDLQYLASYVRGKVTKTIELQGKSPKYQQEYAENDFQIDKKSFFAHFRCYCQDDTLMEKFY